MYENLDGLIRTCYCGEFKEAQLNNNCIAMGWIDCRRDFGDLVFVDLRDRSGIVQVVFNKEVFQGDWQKVDSLRNEFVIAVEGTVEERAGAVNENLATGKIEIKAQSLRVLAEAETPPFPIEADSKTKEELRLKRLSMYNI